MEPLTSGDIGVHACYYNFFPVLETVSTHFHSSVLRAGMSTLAFHVAPSVILAVSG